MQQPLVSVVMPVYNGEQFLRLAVESILAQTYPYFEFIIIDDGSTDSTPAIVHSYRDERIIYRQHNQNMGIVAALNKGIRYAHGVYVARMDADDISLPERLEKQVAFLENHAKVAVLGTCAELIDEMGKTIGDIDFPSDHVILEWEMCFACPVIHPSVMIRRDFLLTMGGYRADFPHTEDYDLWTRISRQARLANLSGRFLRLRKHAANVSAKYAQIQLENGIAISKRMLFTLTGLESELTPFEIHVRPRAISPEELKGLSQTVLALLGQFENNKPLRKEAARQWLFFIRHAHPSRVSVEVLWLIMTHRPLFGLDLAARLIQRIFFLFNSFLTL
jgi:glycosyltransferase involved in cell wall biosynthesis